MKSIGLYQGKAKNIIATCRKLIDEHGGAVPDDRESLEALPGVGRKTANVILNTAFGLPTLAVDTHVFRVSNRIGLAKSKDVRGVEDELLKRIPAEFLHDAHHWLILHGRYVCKAAQARLPELPDCRPVRVRRQDGSLNMPFFHDQGRESLRQSYLDAWRKHRESLPMEPLEHQLATVVEQHPEYHAFIEGDPDAINRDFTPEGGQSNPFLHMGLHLAIREQVATNRPVGIAAIHADLCRRTRGPARGGAPDDRAPGGGAVAEPAIRVAARRGGLPRFTATAGGYALA